MALLTERYAQKIRGILSLYDRIIIQGTLPVFCYAEGMTSFFKANNIRIFDYPRFAEPLRNELRENAERIAKEPPCAFLSASLKHAGSCAMIMLSFFEQIQLPVLPPQTIRDTCALVHGLHRLGDLSICANLIGWGKRLPFIFRHGLDELFYIYIQDHVKRLYIADKLQIPSPNGVWACTFSISGSTPMA